MAELDREDIIQFSSKVIKLFTENKGCKLRCEELISTNGQNYDSHFTSKNIFYMYIENASLRFSGGRLMIIGEKGESYEIDIMSIICAVEDDDSFIIIEQLGGEFTRKSILSLM